MHSDPLAETTILRPRPANPRKWRLKLNPAKAAEIRARYPRQSLRQIGREFDVSHTAVWNIVMNRTWRQ
jgi:hypothetical protein